MPHTIALVDDDRNILTSVTMALEDEGSQTGRSSWRSRPSRRYLSHPSNWDHGSLQASMVCAIRCTQVGVYSHGRFQKGG